MPDNQVAPAMMDGEEEIEPLQRATSSIQDGEDCDPYIKITIPSLRQSRETSHKPHDRNPDWNETLTFHGVTGRTELLDIAVLDHDVMSKDDKLGRQTFRAADLTTGVPWGGGDEGWLDLDDAEMGRIQLEILLQMDGTLTVKCISGRDLPVFAKWEAKAREFRATGLNIRDAWEMDGDGGIPDQNSLPLHPEMPVCARLVTDGYCMFGEKCQFHHPEQIKRKPRPPAKERRLEIKQGVWGYLRDGDIVEESQIDVTDMLKDIVIEQEGIQLELPKKMKHLLWRKGVKQPGSGADDEDGGGAGQKESASEEEEEEEEEEADGEEDEEEEEGDEDDPDAPVRGIGAKFYEMLEIAFCCQEPVYGLKVWYYIKGDRLKIKSWRADQWIYIESYQEMKKRQRKQFIRRLLCTIFLVCCLLTAAWLYFIMAGMSCSNAEYSECFDKDDVYTTPCEMNFNFPTHEIKHIDVSNVRGDISITSSASMPNITVTIRQTVLEEGAMAGLTSNAELVAGVLTIYSRWNSSHESEFPDMYGGNVSIFNCPSAEIVISLPATEDATVYGSLFSPSVTALIDEPEYYCSLKNPQACWFGFVFLTSIELLSKIEFLMAGNDTLPFPSAVTSVTSSFSNTVDRVRRSEDDWKMFPGRVPAFNETKLIVTAGEIDAKNIKANLLEVRAGSGTASIENSKAHLTRVYAEGEGVVTMSGSAMPRGYARYSGQAGWNNAKSNGLLDLIGGGEDDEGVFEKGGAFTVGDVIGGDLRARDVGSVEVDVTLNAFQGVVAGVSAVTAPATCYSLGCKHTVAASAPWHGGGVYVGSRSGCDGTQDWDCTYQLIDIDATGDTSVDATCKEGAGDGC